MLYVAYKTALHKYGLGFVNLTLRLDALWSWVSKLRLRYGMQLAQKWNIGSYCAYMVLYCF